MQQISSFNKQQVGHLYLVPTPIGNLDDMTFRAIKTLRSVDLIAAEDTRHTQQLLNHFEIDTRQISFHEHNTEQRIPELLAKLQDGLDIAQCSDAGMPSISDPGRELVAAAVQVGIPVVPLPGANAGLTALIASGLVPQPFYFYGFLERKHQQQVAALQELQNRTETMIFYEAPHRLKKTLATMAEVFGDDRPAVLARELTKRYEEFSRGNLGELRDWFTDHQTRLTRRSLVAFRLMRPSSWLPSAITLGARNCINSIITYRRQGWTYSKISRCMRCLISWPTTSVTIPVTRV